MVITGPALGAGCLCLLGGPWRELGGNLRDPWDFGTGVIVWVNYSYNPEGPYTLTMELGPKKTIPILVLGT